MNTFFSILSGQLAIAIGGLISARALFFCRLCHIFSPVKCLCTSCKRQNHCSVIACCNLSSQHLSEVAKKYCKNKKKNMLTCLHYDYPKIKRDCFCFSYDNASNQQQETDDFDKWISEDLILLTQYPDFFFFFFF